jgi:hypothetical protein
MKKYVKTTSITDVNLINLVARTSGASGGITITYSTNQTESHSLWGTTRTSDEINNLNKFNLSSYYKIRQLDLFPESEVGNTLITNTGLVLIINSGKLTIYDIYQKDSIVYGDIDPVDYSILLSYDERSNPKNKKIIMYYDITEYDEGRIVSYGPSLPTFNQSTSPDEFVQVVDSTFSLYKKGQGAWVFEKILSNSANISNTIYLHEYFQIVSSVGRIYSARVAKSKTVNSLIFIDSSNQYHFNSQNDFTTVLTKDEYGFYQVSSSSWFETYRETGTFSFLKRPFVRMLIPEDSEVIWSQNDQSVLIERVYLDETADENGNVNAIYMLKDLSVSSANKTIEFKIAPPSEKKSGYFMVF